MKLNKSHRPWLQAGSACVVLLAAALFAGLARAEAPAEPGPSDRTAVIEKLVEFVEERYVDPKRARELSGQIREYQAQGRYESLADGEALAEMLTGDLQQLSGDRHLRVDFSEQAIPESVDAESAKAREAMELDMWRAHNYGLEHVERLPFNIGYLKLTAFPPAKEAGNMLASAMNLVHNMDSLIIDLRGNFGGHEHFGSMLASYLLDERTHLLDMTSPRTGQVDQRWSSDYVQGQRFGSSKRVYILIDQHSFSAAEEFSYTMKHLRRATLVGETTAGAAHAGADVRLTRHFSLFLPEHRPVSPVTNSNWQGSGVEPDIAVAASEALEVAQRHVLEADLAQEQNPRRRQRIQARISELSTTESGD